MLHVSAWPSRAAASLKRIAKLSVLRPLSSHKFLHVSLGYRAWQAAALSDHPVLLADGGSVVWASKQSARTHG